LDTVAKHAQGSNHQMLWQAVIDSAIADWARGPVLQKDKAEYFLFHDEDDFPFVCRSAGLNPDSLRETLWVIRAQAASGSKATAA
jgi:hypothetical protein